MRSSTIRSVVAAVLVWGAAGGSGPMAGGAGSTPGAAVWRSGAGQVVVLPHEAALAELGIGLYTVEPTAVSNAFPRAESVFAIQPGAGLVFTSRAGGGFDRLLGGELQSSGELVLTLPDRTRLQIGNLLLRFDVRGGDLSTVVVDTLGSGAEIFRLESGLLQLSAAERRLEWIGLDLFLSRAWAEAAGVPEAAEIAIATVVIEAAALPAPELAYRLAELPEAAASPRAAEGQIGPDVIVGTLYDPRNWGQPNPTNGLNAYSIGTISCNSGDTNLDWISQSVRHPVIGQNLFRLKDGKFEQLGQSWLKHGFTALQQFECFNDCMSSGTGSALGVHCSDPYGGQLNGSQGGLGPKFEVNAATGSFIWPFKDRNVTSTNPLYKRLQVKIGDVDPAQNAGASYFIEGHYVALDDAAWGNQDNNVSFRQVTFDNNPSPFSMHVTATTVRELPAIRAWAAIDPTVMLADAEVGSDGRFELGTKVTDLGAGQWRYEYALYNMNSWRSAGSFSVPIPAGANLSNIGFHDVDYHSGEPFDGTDWTPVVSAGPGAGSITWSTASYLENPNANALRWGTLYNFRFDADSGPISTEAAIGLFNLRPILAGAAAGGLSRLRILEWQPQAIYSVTTRIHAPG